MKKVAFFLLLLIPLFVEAQQRDILVDITGTDSMYVWKNFRSTGSTFIQFDFTSFGADDSCQVDLYYLIKDGDSYIPTQVEIEANVDQIPLWLSKKVYQRIQSGVNIPDTTNTVAVKIGDFIGDALGIEVIKYSAEADDTIKVRPRK